MADRQAFRPGRLHRTGLTGPEKSCNFARQDGRLPGRNPYIWVDHVGCVAEDRVGISDVPELKFETGVLALRIRPNRPAWLFHPGHD